MIPIPLDLDCFLFQVILTKRKGEGNVSNKGPDPEDLTQAQLPLKSLRMQDSEGKQSQSRKFFPLGIMHIRIKQNKLILTEKTKKLPSPMNLTLPSHKNFLPSLYTQYISLPLASVQEVGSWAEVNPIFIGDQVMPQAPGKFALNWGLVSAVAYLLNHLAPRITRTLQFFQFTLSFISIWRREAAYLNCLHLPYWPHQDLNTWRARWRLTICLLFLEQKGKKRMYTYKIRVSPKPKTFRFLPYSFPPIRHVGKSIFIEL